MVFKLLSDACPRSHKGGGEGARGERGLAPAAARAQREKVCVCVRYETGVSSVSLENRANRPEEMETNGQARDREGPSLYLLIV